MSDINTQPKGIIVRYALVFAVVVAVTLLMLPASAQARYTDGMNLYEYVKSNPSVGCDPQGTVVVAFRGWEKPWVTHSVVESLVAAAGQKTILTEATKEGVDGALESALIMAYQTSGDLYRCPEPIYIVGYSIGSRAALVLAWRLSENKKGLWTKWRNKDGYFVLRQLVFFDYNWGAHHFEQKKPLGLTKYPLGGFPHMIPYSSVEKSLHVYSTGSLPQAYHKTKDIKQHTKNIYRDYGRGWPMLSLTLRYGIKGLANTTGYYAEFETGVSGIKIGSLKTEEYKKGNHFDLGSDAEKGRQIGEKIKKDYQRFWEANRRGDRK